MSCVHSLGFWVRDRFIIILGLVESMQFYHVYVPLVGHLNEKQGKFLKHAQPIYRSEGMEKTKFSY